VTIWSVEKCCDDGKERVNKTFLRCFRKTGRDADDVTESGRLFHDRAAATEKARSPIVELAVAETISAAVWYGDIVSCSPRVPQGSVLGPVLFTARVSPIGDLVKRHGVNQHQYADDIQLRLPMKGLIDDCWSPEGRVLFAGSSGVVCW